MKTRVLSFLAAKVFLLSVTLCSVIPIAPSLDFATTKSTSSGVTNEERINPLVLSLIERISVYDKTVIKPNIDDTLFNHNDASLIRRASFPTTTVAVTRLVKTQFIPILLTKAWEWAVQTVHEHPDLKTQLLSTDGYGFSYEYRGYTVNIRNLVEKGGVTVQDLLAVLASTHDQMEERLGFGIGILNIFNGAKLIGIGLIQHGKSPISLKLLDHHPISRSLSTRAPPRTSTFVDPIRKVTGTAIPSLLTQAAGRVFDYMRQNPFGLIPQDATGFLYRTADYAIQFVAEVGQEVTWSNLSTALQYTYSFFAGTAKWGLAEIKVYYRSTLIATGRIFQPSSGAGGGPNSRHRRGENAETITTPDVEETSSLLLTPRVIPGILPGPSPPDIHVDLNGSLQFVARAAVQRLMYEVWSTLYWQFRQRPNEQIPADGYTQKLDKYAFSIIPREGIPLTWRLVYQAFSLVTTIEELQGFGLGRFDVTK